jgi:hypothetical protein
MTEEEILEERPSVEKEDFAAVIFSGPISIWGQAFSLPAA